MDLGHSATHVLCPGSLNRSRSPLIGPDGYLDTRLAKNLRTDGGLFIRLIDIDIHFVRLQTPGWVVQTQETLPEG